MSRQPGPSRALLALVALLAVAYGATFATERAANDVTSAAVTSWRIAHTGAPWLDGVDYEQYESPAPLWVATARNGHLVAFRSPGPIAAGVPAYLAADAIGVDEYSMVPGSVTASALTVGAMVLLFAGLQQLAGTRLALGGVLALALTTPVWSVSADALWTHPVTLVGLAGMALGCVRERWWLVGVFGGIAIWGRLHTAIIVAIVGLMVGWYRRDPRIPFTVGALSAGFLGLSVVWSRWMYGTWSLAGGYPVDAYVERAIDRPGSFDQLVNHLGLWTAPDKGLLIWTPAIVVLLPALVRAWRAIPLWSRAMVVGGLVYALVQGQLNGFTGGNSFYGYRLMLETLISCAPALILAVPRTTKPERLMLGGLVGLQLTAFLIGASADGGVLWQTESWTDNSFVHLAAEAPVLWVLALTTTLVGVLLARRLDRGAATDPAPDPEPSRS